MEDDTTQCFYQWWIDSYWMNHCSEALKFEKQKTKSIGSEIRRWTNTTEQKIKI